VKVGHLGHQLVEFFVPVAASPHGLEVGSGTEDVAGAGENRHAQVGVLVEHPPAAVHPRQHSAAQGVLRLGAVEGDDQRVAFAFQQTVVEVHGGSWVRES